MSMGKLAKIESNRVLLLRENLNNELALIKTVDAGIVHLNKIKAIEIWMRAEKMDVISQNIIAEQKVRTQRLLGQLIDEGQETGEIATAGDRSDHFKCTKGGHLKTLSELGITRNESSTFKSIYSIPEDVFESFIEQKKEDAKDRISEITTTACVKIANELKKQNDSVKKLNTINDPTDFINEYGINMYMKSNVFKDSKFDEYVFMDYDKFPTLTTQSKFFHKNLKEFSLREYANVQDFPEDFKFIGSPLSIRKQIGNAVDPVMGKYISSKLKGNTVGELFAGCGGFASGIHMNNKKILWAVEWDENAVLTYKINFPNTDVYQINIRHFSPDELDKVDIIIGGPPCQGFSVAKGYTSFKDDPRNELYKEFLRFVSALKPGEFIMENVPQIQDIKEQIIFDFKNIGYDVKTELVYGNKIGMKQDRKRFFFKGKKYELK